MFQLFVALVLSVVLGSPASALPWLNPQPFPAPAPAPKPVPLATYKLDPKRITVSGVSSGAYMAIQMQVAHSKIFSGAASVAGGIYWCSKGDSGRAQRECMGSPQGIQVQEHVQKANELQGRGEIDPLSGLEKARFYLFASPKDFIIQPVNTDKLVQFLKAVAPAATVKFENSVQSAHGFPTLNYGAACGIGMAPWLLKCQVDTAGEILKNLDPEIKSRGQMVEKNLITFDQSPFGNLQTPLYPYGWIYVPSRCAQGEVCGVHVALHGCQMNPDYIQDQFAKNAGFNEWAENNKLIVIYPQSAKMGQPNPYACWDWFGFTGPNYVTKSASQIKALMQMLKALDQGQDLAL